MAETIAFDVSPEGIATLTFNRPDHFNGMTAEMGREIREALAEAARRDDLRVLVLTGAGRSFCPGADIKHFNVEGSPDAGLTSPAVSDTSTPSLLHELPIPTIAAVNGACAGAGFGLACACDLRVASRSAVFRSAFLSVGVAGDMGVPWSLPRLIGVANAKRISFLDEKLTPEQALTLGLVSHVFDDHEFRDGVRELAGRIAAGPPLATRALKAHYLAAEQTDFRTFVDMEFQRHFHLLATRDAREGFVAFGEHRKPEFTGT
jgi:2-(1,2-epoxy-1,2-dihydrophenyl)acetyl-CoA isomerase